MDFGQAIAAMKQGKKVARSSWYGQHMHIFIDKRSNFEPAICMLNAESKLQPGWVASQPDMLGEDWEIVG